MSCARGATLVFLLALRSSFVLRTLQMLTPLSSHNKELPTMVAVALAHTPNPRRRARLAYVWLDLGIKSSSTDVKENSSF